MNLFNVDYHIIDKCNLNCVSCNHFSPLVPKDTKEKSMEQIKSDLYLLSKIKSHINCLTLLGGEPTLHTKLIDILYFARELFMNTEIHLTTNGTTWKNFEKWKDAIIDNNILVVLSKYPYCENYKEGYDYIEKLIPNNIYVYWSGDMTKMMTGAFKKERIASDDDILHCRMRGACCQLKKGKLYICNYAANIDVLKNAFPEINDYIFTEGYEYFDLNDINNENDIENLITEMYYSIPAICFNCIECQRGYDTSEYVDWKKSKKVLSEWVN